MRANDEFVSNTVFEMNLAVKIVKEQTPFGGLMELEHAWSREQDAN